MWFEDLTGFGEESAQQVRKNIIVKGDTLLSTLNGRIMVCGKLETPCLAELRERVSSGKPQKGKISVQEIIANVQHLHADETSRDSLFQVASQFNLLEMAAPTVTPEQGVGGYEYDHTQGPACAIAAGSGTIYRNYFASVNGQLGQSVDNQIDCLADIGIALGNSNSRLWEMKNGYALASRNGLIEISERLALSSESDLDELRQLLRIGIQWDTEVTIVDSNHTVSQAYCSALPVAYSGHSPKLWKRFAQLILEATYEATICAAILNSLNNENNKLFLTLVGGGVFGNETGWIIDAIKRSLDLYKNIDLDVIIVSYGSSNRHIQQVVNQF